MTVSLRKSCFIQKQKLCDSDCWACPKRSSLATGYYWAKRLPITMVYSIIVCIIQNVRVPSTIQSLSSFSQPSAIYEAITMKNEMEKVKEERICNS
mmetsp:Transcript_35524/g.50373  ORF Transcript_35524/g.50373 Transcript_35524/m.50373 type:complete len:96 (+) Transcript_35524:445-732(+)